VEIILEAQVVSDHEQIPTKIATVTVSRTAVKTTLCEEYCTRFHKVMSNPNMFFLKVVFLNTTIVRHLQDLKNTILY